MKIMVILCGIFGNFCSGARIDPETKIVGGTVAVSNQAPYQVSLQSQKGSHICGGAIISDRWILTAAHCVKGIKDDYYRIRVGTNNYKEGGVIYISEKLIPHESYNNPKYNNDIGLIKTKEKIEFTDQIQSVSVSNEIVPDGSIVTLTGWGKLSAGGAYPDMLQTIDLKTISYEECKIKNGGSSSVSTGHLCTFTTYGEGSCNGDSGGPLVYPNEDGKMVLAGAVNWGRPCARGFPDVQARISHYYDWIQKTMKENSFLSAPNFYEYLNPLNMNYH